MSKSNKKPNSNEYLTKRQLEILQLLAHGHTYKSCANKLSISPRTVENTMRETRIRLNATNTNHAVAIALSRGLVLSLFQLGEEKP